MSIITKAIEKLAREKEEASKKTDRYVNVIIEPVFTVLCNFINQEEEFAEAIEQTDKHFSECLKECVNGAGSAISDIDVYKKAVAFYFPGADINFSMTINLSASVEKKNSEIVLSLEDFI